MGEKKCQDLSLTNPDILETELQKPDRDFLDMCRGGTVYYVSKRMLKTELPGKR